MSRQVNKQNQTNRQINKQTNKQNQVNNQTQNFNPNINIAVAPQMSNPVTVTIGTEKLTKKVGEISATFIDLKKKSSTELQSYLLFM